MARRTLLLLLLIASCHRGVHNRQLAAASFTGCLLHDGDVTCWPVRDNEHSELVGTIDGVDDAVQLSTGLSISCVVRRDGTVACWGHLPGMPKGAAAVEGLDEVVQVSAGRSHACAVRARGEVDCWGVDSDGQIGRLPGTWTSVQVPKPLPVPGIDDAVEVSCGSEHSCVRRRDGTVSCFGKLDASVKPGAIDGLRDITALTSGEHFVCGLTRGGEVWCAGKDTLGELGAGDHDPHAGAVRVRGLEHVVQISANEVHACARTESGEVWCWGAEFGHGIMAERTDDMDKGPVRITGLGKAVDLAVGEWQACAIIEDGTQWCWGPAPASQHGQAPPVQFHPGASSS